MPKQRLRKPNIGGKTQDAPANVQSSGEKRMIIRTATDEDYRKRAYETIGPFYRFENGKLKS